MATITRMASTNLPWEIAQEMKWWRNGACPLPSSYVEWMAARAAYDLIAFAEEKGWKVRGSWLEDDGWMDGMKFLHAAVEIQNGTLLKIKYADNRKWYQAGTSGGFTLIGGQ